MVCFTHSIRRAWPWWHTHHVKTSLQLKLSKLIVKWLIPRSPRDLLFFEGRLLTPLVYKLRKGNLVNEEKLVLNFTCATSSMHNVDVWHRLKATYMYITVKCQWKYRIFVFQIKGSVKKRSNFEPGSYYRFFWQPWNLLCA